MFVIFYEIFGRKNGVDIKQTIVPFNSPVETPTMIGWIGDIDRDGIPDFIMELSGHDNTGRTCLFLSSKADSNELVKLVATHTTTGC